MAKPLTAAQKHEWEEKIQEQKTSGFSIAKWCRDNQVVEHAFYYWKKRLLHQQKMSRDNFSELTLTDPKGCTIDIECESVLIHLKSPTLKQCLKILKELKC